MFKRAERRHRKTLNDKTIYNLDTYCNVILVSQKCLGPRVDTRPTRETKDNFCLCNFIIRLRFWLFAFFFAPALVDKQWKTARVMLGHHATICTCKFILHIGRMVYADEREWAKVPKKGWKNGRHTIFFLASQNMLLSLAIVPDFRFPLISFHHQCQKWLQKTHRTTTDPKFIFRFFFRLVCVCVWCHFLRVLQLFFYLLTRPILLVGQSNFCVLYVRLFFLHRVLCYACVFCQGFYFKKWLLFHLVRVLFRVCMLLLLFAVCRALIRKSLWAFIYIILQWHLTDFFCWSE